MGLALQSPALSARSPVAPRLADARNDDGSGDDGHGDNLSLNTPALRLDGGEGCGHCHRSNVGVAYLLCWTQVEYDRTL